MFNNFNIEIFAKNNQKGKKHHEFFFSIFSKVEINYFMLNL